MASLENHRTEVLQRLLTLTAPLEQTAAELAALRWDFAGQPVILTRENIAAAIAKYLHGELSLIGLESWANCIECREDVSFDSPYEQEIAEVMHELANPALTTTLSPVRANELLSQLAQTATALRA